MAASCRLIHLPAHLACELVADSAHAAQGKDLWCLRMAKQVASPCSLALPICLSVNVRSKLHCGHLAAALGNIHADADILPPLHVCRYRVQ